MEAMITPRMDSAQEIQMVVAAASAADPGASAQEEQAGEVAVGHPFVSEAVVDRAFLEDQVEDHPTVREDQEEEVEDHPTVREASAQTDPEDQVDLADPVDLAGLEDPEVPAVEVAGHNSTLATDIPTTGISTEKCRRISCHGMAAGRRIKASGI